MGDILDSTFEEWTKGVDDLQARINIFENVRNIPYAVIAHIRNYDSGPSELIAGMRGSCTPKHFLLGRFFERLSLEIKYVTYPFKWDDPDLKYPDELRKLAALIPTEYHLACKVNLDGKWVLVDATYDLVLGAVGYPINKTWDGFEDLELAVKALDEIEHDGADSRDAYVKEQKLDWSSQDRVQEAVFCQELNHWLEAVRTYGG